MRGTAPTVPSMDITPVSSPAASKPAPVLPETNVSAVPQRSVFRCPGGKTWLVPILRRWIASLPQRPATFVEPFAGGAICGLTVAAEGLADAVVLAEIDPHVNAVWHAIFTHGAADELSCRIEAFHLTRDTVDKVLQGDTDSPVDRAFQTILRNRVQRGGILAPGAGLMKTGENGRGLGSRWYPATLARRIRAMAEYRHKVTVLTADAFEVLERYHERSDVAALIDPPYTAGGKNAGRRLYTHNTVDHPRLFRYASTAAGASLLTYDNAAEVATLAGAHCLQWREAAMRNTHNARMTELLISRDMEWAG